VPVDGTLVGLLAGGTDPSRPLGAQAEFAHVQAFEPQQRLDPASARSTPIPMTR
jgi:hypothetical protein